MIASEETIVEVNAVDKSYRVGANTVHALRDVDLTIAAGTLVALHGRSGSGKTTLLNVVGGLDRADAGGVRVCGVDLMAADDAARTQLRRESVAFIFQGFGLLPMLTATENVEIPMRLRGTPSGERAAEARQLLSLVGLGGRGLHRPGELSGGEQQRVAIARALACSPQLLIADEPTGQLDSRTGGEIMALLSALVAERGVAALVATHDRAIIERADHRIELVDGAVT